MKINASQLLPALLQKKYRAYFLYGYNESLMQGLIQEIKENCAYTIVPEDKLQEEGNHLFEPSLFGDVPDLLIIPRTKQLSWYDSFVKSLKSPYAILITHSHAVPAFSKSLCVASVACYECPLDDSRAIIKRYAHKHDLSLALPVLNWCAHYGQNGHWAEIVTVLSYYDAPVTGEVLSHLFSHFVEEPFATLFLEDKPLPYLGELSLAIIRTWQKLLLQMWQLKVLIRNHEKRQAISMVTPAIFFKHAPILLQKIPFWSFERLASALSFSLDCEKKCKKNAEHMRSWLNHFLYICTKR